MSKAKTGAVCVALGWLLLAHLTGPLLAEGASDPMSFREVVSGGNCSTCYWIAANGVIEKDTSEKFLGFLKAKYNDIPRGMRIHLNSPGGSLIGGVKLGRAIREIGANTAVSSSITVEVYEDGTERAGSEDAIDATCSSACVFAFVGGVSRYASKRTPGSEVGFREIGRLGVHQFYDPAGLSDPDAPSFSASDRIVDQKIVSLLLSHLSTMGVSAELLQIAGATEPTSIHYLSEEELVRTNADNRMVRDVAIIAYRNGVSITEIKFSRQDADYRLELYCHDGAMHMLATIDWRGTYDTQAHREWRMLKAMAMKDGIKLENLSETFENNPDKGTRAKIHFVFKGALLKDMIKIKQFEFEDWSSRHANDAAGQLSFSLPDNFDGLYLLPRTCV